MSWTLVSPSKFPWEQEALDFVRQSPPPTANIHVCSNFEFVADNGSIYEVDMLCVGPWGAFLVEIKSRPATISGNAGLWAWHRDGRSHTAENPLLLANRQCKALRSLLERQKAFSRERVPFIEPLVFCSDTSNQLVFSGPQPVCLRSTIIAVLTRREGAGLKPLASHPLTPRRFVLFCRPSARAASTKNPVKRLGAWATIS